MADLALSPAHVAILERLVAHGFMPVAFPLYASAIGVRRGSFAALLVPAGGARPNLMGGARVPIGAKFWGGGRPEGRASLFGEDRRVGETAELIYKITRL